MALFKIKNLTAEKLPVSTIALERNLQAIFEKNLKGILNITFLAHEYSTSSGGRIDTLGIDGDGSPCIIEYKKTQSNNVINQGLSYLRWLLDHKADFQILCQKKGITVEIDWNSPRVICIAENYNMFDLDTVKLLDLNIKIELFRYCVYGDGILHIERENYEKNKRVSKPKKQKKIPEKREQIQQLKEYSIDDHLHKASKTIVRLFEAFREKVLSLDKNVSEEPKQKYIAYKMATNFVDVNIQKNAIKLYLNVKSGQLKDPHNLARDLTKPLVGHWGNGDYDLKIKQESDIEDVLVLIKQSYNLNK